MFGAAAGQDVAVIVFYEGIGIGGGISYARICADVSEGDLLTCVFVCVLGNGIAANVIVQSPFCPVPAFSPVCAWQLVMTRTANFVDRRGVWSPPKRP